MKNSTIVILLSIYFSLFSTKSNSQSIPIKPTEVTTATSFKVFGPLKDLPNAPESKNVKSKNTKSLNPRIAEVKTPYRSNKIPKEVDNSLQSIMGTKAAGKIKEDWDALEANQTIIVTDCIGAAGPNHYLQAINMKFTVYDKEGTQLTTAKDLTSVFKGLDGSGENDGDPVILYDEQANRYILAAFSGHIDPTPPYDEENYILMAVSQTGDPTGSWNAYSFPMNGFPDYFKIGVRRDGYYISSYAYYHPDGQDDIYVVERDVMLAGGANPKIVKFDNEWHPVPTDLETMYHCIMPLDTDGDFEPIGTPGMYITIHDDAWGGSSDQLWLYELDTDWDTPSNSTFNRTQQITVDPFDTHFGFSDKSLTQKGTSQKLGAGGSKLMYRAQYRNFGTEEVILCYHTVDVDDTDHAGLRWYELVKTTGDWSVRQSGTYAPDANHRFMGSISMNGDKEIAIGYAITGNDLYPGIRFTGQSASEREKASGIFDIAETEILAGTYSNTTNSRWADYSSMCVDPTDDHTFWYANEYVKNSIGLKGTYIASFEFNEQALSAGFFADNTTPVLNTSVLLSDASSGNITSWKWTFSPSTIAYVNGTDETSQNPQVQFSQKTAYTVTLDVSDGTNTDQAIKIDYINPIPVGINSISNKGELMVYSNRNKVYCKTPENYTGKITIYNTSGKIVYEDEVSSEPITLKEKGIYVARLFSKGKYFSGKLVIN